jgi:hypothetical protein
MKINSALSRRATSSSRSLRSGGRSSGRDGIDFLKQHRTAGILLTAALTGILASCLIRRDIPGAIQIGFFALIAGSITLANWWAENSLRLGAPERAKSAQECADLIVSELRLEGLAFDEEALAESVASVLLQQRLDLSGFVDATVESSQDGLFHVVGIAHRRSGERIEFMTRLCLWWSGGGQVHCDSLGMVWS